MASFAKLGLLGTITSFFLSPCLASPAPSIYASMIGKRFLQDIIDCGNNEAKVRKDFGDAALLAQWAFDRMDTNGKAYTHYFRFEGEGKDEDWGHVKSMYSSIASNNDPTNPSYVFNARCAGEDEPLCKPGGEASFAFTDPAPQDGDKPRVITICPRYFTDPLTQNSLDAKEYIKDPKRGQNSWCQPGNNFRFFSVGGETLLHEMTHLDALAKAADYPADSNGEHGTMDTSTPPKGDPVAAARNLAKAWQNAPQGSLEKPWQNAESIAAAALESYFMNRCGFDDINI